MNLDQLKSMEDTYHVHTFKRFNLAIKSGQGSRCVDFDGKEYIDFSAGIGVNSLGFCNPDWVEAVTKQVSNLVHISNLYYSEPAVNLAQKLCTRTGMKKVFFSNSGAEANECAIKAARKYGIDKYGEKHYEILSLNQSFHGRTMATLTATGQPAMHKPFGPMLPGFVYADANNFEDVLNKVTENTTAIMLESIQGEGGVNNMDYDFVRKIAELCEQKDMLLIMDEVQTGIARTGKFLSYEHYDVKPDIVTLAKGLGGGLPIGAILFSEKAENIFSYGDHGSTYVGNPVACAGALEVLNQIDDKFISEVQKKSEYIREKLNNMTHVKSVSGRGLMIGIELDEKLIALEIVQKCIENGLIILTAKTKLRLLPPLNISYEDIEDGLNILENVLKTY